MILKTKKGEEFLISDEDYDLVSKYIWRVGPSGYITRKQYNKEFHRYDTMFLHRYILNIPKGKLGDHINGNKFDNRRCNLRICNNIENSRNTAKHRDNKNSFKGVSWHKKDKRFRARIHHNGKTIHLGNYKTETEAANAYNEAAIKYYKEFARLNII